MDYFPGPRSFRRIAAYAVIALLIALFFVDGYYGLLSNLGLASTVGILVLLVAFLLIERRRVKMFGFDSKGVYKHGRILFGWNRVRRIGLRFNESTGSFWVAGAPSWRVVLSGPVVERETWVNYGVSVLFTLDDGSEVSIHSNLDRITGKGVVEKVDELARAANPSIVFE